VDIINGAPGHEFKYEGRRLVANYLRIGREANGAWRTYKLRQDFVAADKVQMEDDITASVVVPARRLVGLPGEYDGHPSLKIAQNCEYRLFQRPDDAIHRARTGRPRRTWRARALLLELPAARTARAAADPRTAVHDAFTAPMREHVDRNAASESDGWSICPAQPRLIGEATQEPPLPPAPADLAGPATGTSPRWGPG
jgi:hypothetical protein